MRTKIVVFVILLGGFISTFSIALLAISTRAQAKSAVDSIKAANKQARDFNKKEATKIAANETFNKEHAKEIKAKKIKKNRPVSEEIKEITSIDKSSWIVTSAIVGVATFALLGLAVVMLMTMDAELPITWAQAIVFSGVAFYFLILVNGVIPHYMLDVWDNVFKLKGTVILPLTKSGAKLFNDRAVGLVWDKEVFRDMIVAGWYGISFVATIVIWYWAQIWPKRQAEKAVGEGKSIGRSPYGRPLFSTGK